MMSNLSDKIVRSLREIYGEPGSRAFFDWAAARERDAAQTRIAVIADRTGMAEHEARDLAYRLEELGCCEFIVGRKGHPSRAKWTYILIGLGEAARGDTNKLEEIDPELEGMDADLVSEAPLTIPEAKRRLAETLGVSPDSIEITVKA